MCYGLSPGGVDGVVLVGVRVGSRFDVVADEDSATFNGVADSCKSSVEQCTVGEVLAGEESAGCVVGPSTDIFWREGGIPCWKETGVLGEDGCDRYTEIGKIIEERCYKCLKLRLGQVTSPEWIKSESESTRSVGSNVEVSISSSIRESSEVAEVRSDTIPEGRGAESGADREVKSHCGDRNLGIRLDDN